MNLNLRNFNFAANQRFRRPYKQQNYVGRARGNGRVDTNIRFNGRGARFEQNLNAEQQGVQQGDGEGGASAQSGPVVPAARNSGQIMTPGPAVAAKSKKSVDGILCFRCDIKGHVATECTVVLCIYCDSAKHQDKDCHLLTMPKPTAVLYGLCRESLNSMMCLTIRT
jgi:hypothetical protein